MLNNYSMKSYSQKWNHKSESFCLILFVTLYTNDTKLCKCYKFKAKQNCRIYAILLHGLKAESLCYEDRSNRYQYWDVNVLHATNVFTNATAKCKNNFFFCNFHLNVYFKLKRMYCWNKVNYVLNLLDTDIRLIYESDQHMCTYI